MADITTRETSGGGATVKGSPLTNSEVDTNFINLNADKVESGGDATLADVTVDSLQFTGGTGTQGTVSWNVDEETLDVILDGATLQMGQEVHYHVRNNTASTISNGTPVMVTGTIGASGRLTIAPMDATDQENGIYYIGVTTEDIAADADGKVTHFGKIRNLDTSAYADGDVLWLSTSTVGAFTTTEPSTGIKIPAAIVINSHASTGTLFCRYQGGYGIHDMHDFDASVTPVDNDVVAYDATSGTYQPQSAAEAGLATAAQGSLADTALQPADLTVTTNAAGTAALTYTSGTGVFSYTPPDLSSYLTSYTETDTLDSVTDRGATTTNAITVGNLTSTGIDDNATSTAITIDSSENVGIGTASPSRILSVESLQQYVASFTRASGTAYVSLNDSATTSDAYVGVGAIGNDFSIRAGNGERMRIDSSGNVGIGTSSPSRLLDVYSNSAQSDLAITASTTGQSLLAFANTADTNVGAIIYDHATDHMRFRVNDAERMRIDSAGNLGIGTASPSELLHIAESTGTSTLRSQNDSGSFYFGIDNSTGGTFSTGNYSRVVYSGGAYPMVFATNNTERMRIDSSGNVGIGSGAPTTAGLVNLKFTGTNGLYLQNTTGGAVEYASFTANTSTGEVRIGATNAGAGVYFPTFYSNGLERMRIDSAGQLLFNCTTNSQFSDEGVKLVGGGRIFTVSSYSNSAQESLTMYSTGASAFRFYVDWGGTIHATSTSISGISDERLKENIADLETGLTEVMSLKPRRFDWKDDDKKNVAGFVAQEVETVLPDLVDQFKHNTLEDAKGVRVGDMIPTLVKAIQEQQAMIEELKAEVTALKGA